MDYRKEFLNYCNSTIWYDDTQDEILFNLSKKAFNDLKKEKSKTKKVYRICGQSGSGKTTQLLYAINEVLIQKDLNPVIIAVRNFATYHPNYQKLYETFGKGEIREKTNGFALKLLCLTLCEFIENGYFIVMDITLLSPQFEKIVLELLKENGYKREYLIMSVPKEQSQQFITKRQQGNQQESSRVVYKNSSNFFYDILPEGLKFLTQNDKNSSISVWSAYQKEPVYYGMVKNSFEEFIKHRKILKEILISETELREFKTKFLSVNFNLSV